MSATILSFQVFKIYSKISFQSSRLHQNNSTQFVRRIFYVTNNNAFNKMLGFQKISNFKSFSIEASRSTKQVEDVGDRLSYQQMMFYRKRQAQNSILIEVADKEDVSHAAIACEKFGAIENVFTNSGQLKNVFLLLEFSEENSVKKLLNECQNENNKDAFPISSRILNYQKKLIHDVSNSPINISSNDAHTVLKKFKPIQVSEMIEDLYFSEKLSELSIRIRFFFCEILKNSISGLFPHCEVLPFGSSVNGVGKEGCDLDIVIRLYPSPKEKYQFSEFSFLNKTCLGKVQDLQRRSVHGFGSYFRTFLPGVFSVKEVLNARVPILKLEHKLLGIDCDISFNQMSAVLMSEMLYFCGEVDSRVRPLLCAVKRWAKDTNVTYQYPGSWITNFGLSLLVIFFLQNRPSSILPCFNDAMTIVGDEGSADFKVDYLIPLSNFQAKAASNEESLAVLLKEFLAYLGSNPFKNQHISVLSGLASKTETNSPICVQYPLEEEKNVTKNVSQSELDDMCEKAQLSCKYLSDNLKSTKFQSGELSTILGSAFIMKNYRHKSIKS